MVIKSLHTHLMEQFNEKQEFEVHVTIKSTDNIDPFIEICNNFVSYANNANNANNLDNSNSHVFSCKPIIIELPVGVYQQQPMCSMFVRSTLKEAIKYGELFAKYCQEAHNKYIVCRNKVEARFRNVKNNTINLDLINNKEIYWEFHIKILFEINDLIINDFRENLEKIFPSARLSRSALSHIEKRQSGETSRVITLRLYTGDKNNAQKELDNLVQYLNKPDVQSKYSFKIRNHIEEELSVYDTNVFHDAGWIHMKQ